MSFDVDDVGNYIAAHTVEASVTTQSSGKEDTGAVILDEARYADLFNPLFLSKLTLFF